MKNTSLSNRMNGSRWLAWMLLTVFCFDLLLPLNRVVYAGGGGPTQPEVQGFTPIGFSDMVDPFTGDFSYNIPLMDVEGYPINIAYSSGIAMDQEASWVGLGWNLNTGTVVRSMRGLPDDFDGDEVEKTQTQKPNTTIGLDFGLGLEIIGKEIKKNKKQGDAPGSFAASLGFNWNNYTGIGVDFSFGPSFKFADASGQSLTAGFQLSGSSENGAGFKPSVSYSKELANKDGMYDRKMTSSIGSAFNSRAGLSYISYSQSMSAWAIGFDRKDKMVRKDLAGGASGSYDLGLHTYSPTVGPSMLSFALSGNWKLSGSVFAVDGSVDVGLSYSRQWIPEDKRTYTNPAYGYFNLEDGQAEEKALLDFNRDNDGSFTKYSPALPSTHLTYDVFSIQAQGAGGSFRGFRNEVGYVFDPKTTTASVSGGVGLESGFGNVLDLGVDVNFNVTFAHQGAWNGGSNRADDIHFEEVSGILEKFAMQEANEKGVDNDGLFASQFYGSSPVLFPLGGFKLNPTLKDNVSTSAGSSGVSLSDNSRDSRLIRNQVLSMLTVKEVRDGLGISGGEHPLIYPGARDHHIGEITQLGTDGRRYVFGLPAYNHYQEDVSFAVGADLQNEGGLAPTNPYSGLVGYLPSLASPSNNKGIDNYYSSTKTPGYAHAFMLTAVLSDDYIDSDGEKGPTDDDLGSYVKFSYEKVDSYQWRTPIEGGKAFLNEGLKTDPSDDKASFVHGEKDLMYLDVIETKNYIAVFETDFRDDAGTAAGRNGGVSNLKRMKYLKKISLYSKPDYYANPSTAIPLQEVHFDYTYELCPGYKGNSSGGGKLTLKEIYFTYQGSYKMKRSSYVFDYGFNPSYNMKAVDRWGNYQPISANLGGPLGAPMNNADYPYTNQNAAQTNQNVAAWCLRGINLPSGGRIQVEYESDDYAFVQHLPAQRMLKIIGVEGLPIATNPTPMAVAQNGMENKLIYFELNDPSADIRRYVTENQELYFRCLMDFRNADPETSPTKYEYVSGYGKVVFVDKQTIDGQTVGVIRMEGELFMDNGITVYNPIAKAAIQMGRLHMPRYINDPINTGEVDGSEQGLLNFANSVAGAFTSLQELFKGPNLPIYQAGRGVRLVTHKSWIRLNEVTGHKLGGGVRVKKILMSDNWDRMIAGGDPNKYSYDYGQEFNYNYPDGRSSGVASYEPQAGGDENPWHQPVKYANKKRFAPDEKLYIEEPLMESQFPSPSVGYARVEIKDLPRAGVKRTATGKVVKEFFTAKDFPTIVSKTDLDLMPANSFLPLLPKYQYLTASQGFAIELNDMHGKPRKESVYAENSTAPISTVDYQYMMEPVMVNGRSAFRLKNTVQSVDQDGVIGQSVIGVKTEGVADFRESETTSFGGSADLNTNTFLLGFLPIVLPTVWPKIDISHNRFRSATMNKVTNRFGILEKTTANQDGSIVETHNLAYDAQTGEVLLTQTTTNFNDKVYSMNYPAFWKYDLTGQAYRNIGYERTSANFDANGVAVINGNYFVPGDELAIISGSTITKGWVIESSGNKITVQDRVGDPITLTGAHIKVIRSGRRNKQTTSMASLTAIDNPLNALGSNQYTNVLNAGAVEFSEDWQTYCDCFDTYSGFSRNPYVLGIKGNWRPVKSFTHLSGRTQSNYNDNTNIRKDGVFSSYTPYYRLVNKDWQPSGQNWTYVSEVTEFSPNGMTLETRDALGRYSASLFGFNNTLTTAVAANTRLRQLEFSSFEDDQYSNCMDQNLFAGQSQHISTTVSHTGRKSIKVSAGNPLIFGNTEPYCAPEPVCKLALDPTPSQAGTYTILEGSAPYQVETEIISGSGDAILNSNGTVTISYTTTQRFEANITVTDAKGCRAVYKVSAPATISPAKPILYLELVLSINIGGQ